MPERTGFRGKGWKCLKISRKYRSECVWDFDAVGLNPVTPTKNQPKVRFFAPLLADFLLIICFYPPLRENPLTAEMRLVPHLQHKPLSFLGIFSLPTAPQFLRADRHGQPLFVAFSPALISVISFFISAISTLSFSSHSSRVVA